MLPFEIHELLGQLQNIYAQDEVTFYCQKSIFSIFIWQELILKFDPAFWYLADEIS